MKLGVIGTGYWGSNHARVASTLESEGIIDSVIFCDKDESRVEQVASDYEAEYVTDHTELQSLVDAAVIATPSTTHEKIATDLLKGGVDCLVEKPIALSSDEAWNIVNIAKKHDQTLAVGHIFRYHPALQELKQRIDRGELGQIKYINTNRFSFRVPRKTSGVLHQLAVHDIDIYKYLLGRHPNQLYCDLSNWIYDDIDETAAITLTYDNAVGTINESWQVPVFGKKRELVVVGTERAAYLDYLDDTKFEMFESRVQKKDRELRAVDEGSITQETENQEPLKLEVLDFINSIRSQESPKASGQIGAETIELIEKAQESNATGESVTVDK